jgi:hypothetical protein
MNATHKPTDGRSDGPTLQASIGSLLADETRIDILRELYAVTADEGGDGLSFSTLRRRVDVSDSGRFNYHLDQLSGQLVTKTDDRYTLTRVGERLVRAFEDSEP